MTACKKRLRKRGGVALTGRVRRVPRAHGVLSLTLAISLTLASGVRMSRYGEWQGQPHHGAAVRRIRCADLGAVRVGDLPHDREPKP